MFVLCIKKNLLTNINSLNKFKWSEYIINGLFGDHGDLKVTSDEIILVEDPAYLVEFSQIYNDVVNDATKIKLYKAIEK
jgi:hypothetical protein